jgi:intraflagellar transport protein 172
MCWPPNRPNDIVFGCSDGKVYNGSLKSNKAVVINDTENYVVSMSACTSTDSTALVTGHLDQSIYRVSFGDAGGVSKALVAQCPFIPYALAWGAHIVAAGNTNRVMFYDQNGKVKQQIEHTVTAADEKKGSGSAALKEFTCASVSPSGQTVVLGNFDK